MAVAKNEDTIKFWERVALGLFSVLTSISLGIAGWTLSQAWESHNDLTRLETRQQIILQDIDKNKALIDIVKVEAYRVSANQQLLDQRMRNIESDIGQIKIDIRKILESK